MGSFEAGELVMGLIYIFARCIRVFGLPGARPMPVRTNNILSYSSIGVGKGCIATWEWDIVFFWCYLWVILSWCPVPVLAVDRVVQYVSLSGLSLATINVAGARLVLNLKSYSHYEMRILRTQDIFAPSEDSTYRDAAVCQ